jgi:U4/U6.U5 tri-snRNP-associated protein 3
MFSPRVFCSAKKNQPRNRHNTQEEKASDYCPAIIMSSSEAYDPRRRREDNERRPPPRPATSSRPRERSRSPPPAAAETPQQAARRARMARLRAENDQEEEEKLTGPSQATQAVARQPQEEIIQVNPDELEGLDEEEQMRKLMGLEGFGSTKGQKVASNHDSLAKGKAKKHKGRTYNQFMNRKGGFNQPLAKMN